MTKLILDRHGRAFVDGMKDNAVAEEVTVVHPIRERGYSSGAAVAPNEELLVGVIDASLTCMLDETQRELDRERAYENMMGFLDGYTDMMAVRPLQFLTRQQTAKVQRLPRRLFRAWMSEYQRGVKRWRKRGGTLVEGNRPELPEIPG